MRAIRSRIASHEGVIYGIPHDLSSAGVVYDVGAFEEAGLDADPFAMATWADLREYARRLTVGTDDRIVRSGISFSIIDGQALQSWLVANGASLYSPDFTRIALDTPQALEALEFFLELRDGMGVLGGGAVEDGTAAIRLNYGNFAGFALETARPDLTFRYTSMPPGPSGSGRTTVTWSNMVSIVSSSENADLAWEYVKFYTGLETRIAMLTMLQRLSAHSELYSTGPWREAVEKHPYMSTYEHMAMVGEIWPFIATSTAVQAAMEEVQGILAGSISPAGGLLRAAERGTAILRSEQNQRL